ncbi:hypothetical protein HDU83_009331 [Entophlyctis luteolus]|nr:hypothetical protein HDU82_004930 [Entophlyctis luteolus]KAJ3350912.1 hypothetical protein HDU83_009331 [Entophlyctis luteolus]KAJ3388955.1 hypothetical protein HDU84_009279 [Entophlyctis sp. JEL0112]
MEIDRTSSFPQPTPETPIGEPPEDVDSPPLYAAIGLSQILYFSPPLQVGEASVTRVSAAIDHNFLSSYFTIDHYPTTERPFFRVAPNGNNFDPDCRNEFYYSFRFVENQTGKNLGPIGAFRISGGKGARTPSQVRPLPAFMHIGTRADNSNFAEFLNPFKSGRNFRYKQIVNGVVSRVEGSLVRYEWISLPRDGDESLYHLQVWVENVRKKSNAAKTTVAELRISPSGFVLIFSNPELCWSSMEECAFLVGTAFGAHAIVGVKPTKIRKAKATTDTAVTDVAARLVNTGMHLVARR